ncbi:MAG TPA: Lsr2 family protein [Chloroflexota bacterium]|nr:Lsr2 family protein [Chloroflexota bacterium]
MCQPVGTWADTATARTWFALNSRRHSAVTSGRFSSGVIAHPRFVPATPCAPAATVWFSNCGLRLSTLMHRIHRINDRNGAAMAQKVQTLFLDDLDGSEAEGTVRFGLEGTEYEIDLNAQHARQLRDALARYVAAGGSAPAPGGQPAADAKLSRTP